MSAFTQFAGGALAYSSAAGESRRVPEELGYFTEADAPENSARGWARAVDELLRIRRLEDDWDGEGTEAPHPALVDGAITLAQALRGRAVAPPDRVHAGVNATVYFEWHRPIGYCEIEVTSPIEAESRFVRAGSLTTEVARIVHLS